LTGNTDIEDSLDKLDKLTQEEARVASAEMLKMTRSIDDKVQGIGSDVRGVDNKLDQANRSLSPFSPAHRSECSDCFTGNQLRDSLFRWLSPPDPSINHNIASKAHHKGTAEWLLQGSIFNQWKSTGSFLWIHGKRAFTFTFTKRRSLINFYSGFREKCRLVRPSTPSAVVKLTSSIQFLDYTRYHGPSQHWEGISGLLLF
jgi:hypothetical protein